ncbi:hypothetical protein BJ508DRAFT_57672 [Ascobolus immersus RN42]|uniref:Uncharacterized protein n=1 Tax=Ascobolus immersus RN42 TaxID=1160509 RepID=A0A3N4HG28_ASCIM|nr:hypothetical protein BJ508DRAFT_57672 [Ascobolus immersus RN42]
MDIGTLIQLSKKLGEELKTERLNVERLLSIHANKKAKGNWNSNAGLSVKVLRAFTFYRHYIQNRLLSKYQDEEGKETTTEDTDLSGDVKPSRPVATHVVYFKRRIEQEKATARAFEEAQVLTLLEKAVRKQLKESKEKASLGEGDIEKAEAEEEIWKKGELASEVSPMVPASIVWFHECNFQLYKKRMEGVLGQQFRL